jgi:hypothetical protein
MGRRAHLAHQGVLSQLGEKAAEVWVEGRALAFEDAVELALKLE